MVRQTEKKKRSDTVEERRKLAEAFSDYSKRHGHDAAATIAAKFLLSFAIHKQTKEARFKDIAGEVLVKVELPDDQEIH